MLGCLLRNGGGVDPAQHYLATPLPKSPRDLIGPQGHGGHQGDSHQIRFLIEIDILHDLIHEMNLELRRHHSREDRKAGGGEGKFEFPPHRGMPSFRTDQENSHGPQLFCPLGP